MKAEYQVMFEEIVIHHLFRGRHCTPELILITIETYFSTEQRQLNTLKAPVVFPG